MPQISVTPIHGAPGAPLGLFVAGMLVPGVRAVVDEGGDILVVLRREAVRIDPAAMPVETFEGVAYPTDGAA